MTDSEPSKKELLERIEQLEEQQEKLTQGAVDSQGRRWTLSDFLNMGLKRRQAIKAISLVAGGASIGAAVMRSVSAAPGDDGDTVWGSSSNRDDYYADELDANLVSTAGLSISDEISMTRTDVTISSGSISADGTFLAVASEDGDTDDLVTIGGGSNQDIIILRRAGTGDITVRHAQDNIYLNGASDRVLDNYRDRLLLQHDAGDWVEISFSDNF